MSTTSQPRLPKVTESLRRQWANQRSQSIEERTHDQSGRPRPPESVWEQDVDVAVMDALLALPIGARFDARAIQYEVRTTMSHSHPSTASQSTQTTQTTQTTQPAAGHPAVSPEPAPVAEGYRGTLLSGAIRGQGSQTIYYDAEFAAYEGDLWTVKAGEFDTETEAWEWIGTMRGKPVWAACFWRVTEVRRSTSGMVWGPTPASDDE